MARGPVGSFAARQTLWSGRWRRNVAGPLQGASLPGVPLLPTFVPGYNFAALLGFGVDPATDPSTWTLTDVSLDVQQTPGISITRGRFDEQSTTMPAQCTLVLDNRSGNYSTRRPQSIYYPNVRVGMPLKIVVATATNTYERFSGFVDDWTAGWDTTGNYSIINVTAHGVMQRLGQNNAPLRSALYRALPGTSPVAYWPLEDGSAATSGANVVSGGASLVLTRALDFSGNTIPDALVSFASGGAPGGSDQLADFSSGAHMQGVVPAGSSATSWRVEFSTKMSSFDTAGSPYMCMLHINTTGDISFHEVLATRLDLGGVYVDYVDKSGAFGPITTSTTRVDDGQWHRITVAGSKSGSDIVVTVYVDGVQALTTTYAALTFGRVTSIDVNPGYYYSTVSLQGFGHLAVWAPWSSTVNTTYVQSGYAGEVAGTRAARICTEESIPFQLIGTSTATMGPQPVAGPLDILRECEAVDGGVLEDGVNFGFALHAVSSRYNQTAALAPALTQLAPPLNPVESNQRMRNDVTVARSNGSSARYTQPSGLPYAASGPGGVGAATDPKTLNLTDDSTTLGRAAWFVHLGTVDADRHPTLNFNFAARTALILSWLACGNGSRITAASTYPTGGQAPDVLLEGWTEDLSTFMWAVTANCSPAAAWTVSVFDSAIYDSATSTLATDATIASTSLTVNVTGTTLWKTGAVSFDINVGGVRFPVTNISGATSPQTFTVSAPTNGAIRTLPAGTSVRVWNTPIYAL